MYHICGYCLLIYPFASLKCWRNAFMAKPKTLTNHLTGWFGIVFVFCLFVCLFVCLYPSTVKASSVCKMYRYGGVRINDVKLWVSLQVLLPSSFISVAEYVIFHFKRRNFSTLTNWRETIWYIRVTKRWYILI